MSYKNNLLFSKQKHTLTRNTTILGAKAKDNSVFWSSERDGNEDRNNEKRNVEIEKKRDMYLSETKMVTVIMKRRAKYTYNSKAHRQEW